MKKHNWKIICEDTAYYVEFYPDDPDFPGHAYPTLFIDGVEREARLLDDQKTLRVSISAADIDRIKEVMTPRLFFSSLRNKYAARKVSFQTRVFDKPAGMMAPDSISPGKFNVIRYDYDYGDEALALPDAIANVEFRAAVYMPEDTVGARPVVIFLHGRHTTCYGEGGLQGTWPCSIDYLPIPSHEGYSLAASSLASHGYVVISLSANGIFPIEAAGALSIGGTLRGHLILAHLDLLAEANAGNRAELAFLTGRLDLQNIGLMGHSRGGGGIARAITLNRLFNKGYGIQGALFLGSTAREGIAIPDTHTAVVLPFLDGDVQGLTGQGFSDLSRYAFDDNVLRSVVLMLGGNHNYFNPVWSPGFPGGSDDAAMWDEVPVTRLTQPEQELLGSFYIAGFFRLTLGAELQYLPLFDGSLVTIPVLPEAQVRSSAHFPASSIYMIQSFETIYSGEALSMPGNWDWNIRQGVGEIVDKASFNIFRYTHNTYHSFLNLKSDTPSTPAQLELYPWQGSEPVDISGYTHLSFHVTHLLEENSQETVELYITLQGGVFNVSRNLSALWPVPEINPGVGTVLKQQISVPLKEFRIDMSMPVNSLSFTLPGGGNIYLSDIAFVKPSLGETGSIRLPFVSIEDVHIVPTGLEQELEINVTLSEVSANRISMRIYTPIRHMLQGIMRFDAPLVFESGETSKSARFLIPAGGFQGDGLGDVNFISVIEARALSNALFDRERALLTTPRPGK
ncbi:hypothetical protein AABC73_05715 [Pseudomonas sp. G.S.17]|uniref:hypothetical protein n=1 Tax=Pseudomonas sp. G.S.17 TaxID=3137451 RepID=UPI00311CC975